MTSRDETETAEPTLEQLEHEEAELHRAKAERERAREEERRQEARLSEIQRAKAERKKQAAAKKAAERIKGISRGYGGATTAFEDAVQKFEDAVELVVKAGANVNGQYNALARFRAEDNALVHCFGVKGAKLPDVLPPDANKRIIEAMRRLRDLSFVERRNIDPHEEQCAHRLRRRRIYREVEGTPGYDIIAEVGPKEFAALNEAQQRIIERRQREQEQAQRSVGEVAQLARETMAALALDPRRVRSI